MAFRRGSSEVNFFSADRADFADFFKAWTAEVAECAELFGASMPSNFFSADLADCGDSLKSFTTEEHLGSGCGSALFSFAPLGLADSLLLSHRLRGGLHSFAPSELVHRDVGWSVGRDGSAV